MRTAAGITVAVLAAQTLAVATPSVEFIRHADPAIVMLAKERAQPRIAAAAAEPECSDEHDKAFELIYAIPSDVPSRLTTLRPTLLQAAADAAQRIVDESAPASVRPKFLCGLRQVVTARAASGYPDDPFYTIVQDLQARGLQLSNRKYVIWWDGPNHPFACGEGSLYDDDRQSPLVNANDGGPSYALIYKPPSGSQTFCGWTTVLHEMMHTIGAVVGAAPNRTPNFHCTDEVDIMCYADGQNVETEIVCPGPYEQLDCNNDDYFGPEPAPALEARWNTYRSSWLERAPVASSGGVVVTSGPDLYTRATTATFTFTGPPNSVFACRLDQGPPEPCTTPRSYSSLPEGIRTFSVSSVGPDGTESSPATYSWTIDHTPPSVSFTPPPFFQTVRSFFVSWTASDNSGVAVESHQARVRSASITSPTFTAPSIWRDQTYAGETFHGRGGYTYCFSIRAFDRVGNVSAYTDEECTVVPIDDRSLSSSGFARVSNNAFFDRTVSIAYRRGATLTYTGLQAKTLAIRLQLCSACGSMEVLWNGKILKRLALAKSPARTLVVPIATFPSVARGTLQLRVTQPNTVVDAVHAAMI